MGTRTKPGSKRTNDPSKRAGVRRVDPIKNRPPNADEQPPETLVPEIVHQDLSDAATSPDASDRETRIARRAYELAEARGFAPGAELDDWLQAEREVSAQSVKQVPPEDQFTG